MKKFPIILLLLIVVPSVLADWFYNSKNIIANIKINGDAEIVPLTPTGYIETATINITFFPKQTPEQELVKFRTIPEAELTENSLKFTWKRPEGKIDFGLSADVKTTNKITEIRQKINFPIQEFSEDVTIYTKPSETIDSNNEDIVRIASELVKGEDDLYFAVFKIADWTKNNINYNLSTLTAEVSQKASWVLQNKQGVCDELTSLFIALLRAVGIPARFVSGIAYTNSPLFPENWGAHGWAEVYFPGYGWVPFDVTYGEFGWIDPTHIKFKDSVDSDEPSTYYTWRGRNANLKTRKLDIKTNLIDKIGYFKVPLNLGAVALKKAVNFGSYNLLSADVENLNDFYYATELYLSKPKEVKIIANEVSLDFMSNKDVDACEQAHKLACNSTDFAVVGDELKSILLLPREKKKIFWIVKLEDKLDSRYSYTFPLVVSTSNNISTETTFTSNIRERYVSFEEIGQIAKLLEEEKQKSYSGNVLLDCKAGKSQMRVSETNSLTTDEFYEYEDVKLYCYAKNTGNVFLDDVDICFEDKCDEINIGISQTKNVTFEINKSNIGFRDIPVVLSNDIVSKTFYVNFKVNDIPKVQIEDLDFPVNASYNENFTISFVLAKKSQSTPKGIVVIFSQNGIEKRWEINELLENRKFALSFDANQLKYGKNHYKINVNYYDGLNKLYNVNKEFSIELTNATILQRLILSLNRFAGIRTEAIAIMLLTGTIAFLGVVLWLFRRGEKT